MSSDTTDRSARDDRFEDVDWEAVEPGGRRVPRRALAFAAGLAVLAAGYLLQRRLPADRLPWVALSPLDWLTAASLLAVAAFAVVPLVRNRRAAARGWRRFRTHRLGVLGAAYVVAFVAVGLVGPLLVSWPDLQLLSYDQPPVGASVDAAYVNSCVGDVVDGRCRGTWRYPLGTTFTGQDLVPFAVYGARTTLQVVVVSTAVMVPTGTAVGLVAAHAGGRVDALLMRFSEVLQTVPAVLLYLLVRPWVDDHLLLVMVAAFGLASWGGLARLVRNEARKRREQLYVRAAEGAGADRWTVLRRHLLPNVSAPLVTNATLQIPMLVLTEAALSFLGLGDPTVESWGQTIAMGIRDQGLHPGWWVTAVPSALLVATVLAFNAVGDALNEALDPRDDY